MDKLLENPDYIVSHLDKAVSLFTGLMDNSLSSKDSASKIAGSLGLLYTKIKMRQSYSLLFDLNSGFPIKDEFLQLGSHQNQAVAYGRLKYDYSPKAIRENIILRIDSLPLDDFYKSAEQILDDGVIKLEKYHYSTKLLQIPPYGDYFNINVRIIEEGKSNLVGIDMFGFSKGLNSFVNHNIELYDTPGVFSRKKFTKKNGRINISDDVFDNLTSLFSNRSNILFYELSKSGNMLVRKSERKIFGPLYSPITISSKEFSGIDPKNEDMASLARDSSSFILSVHNDCSTEYYNPDDYDYGEKPDREKMIKNPFMEKSHKYVVDKQYLEQIAQVAPRHEIIAVETKLE